MKTLHQLRRFIHNVRYGWISVLLFYLTLTAAAYLAYHYAAKLPEAQGLLTPADLWRAPGTVWAGLQAVWFIFAWGFGIQLIIQISRVFRRRPRDADMGLLIKHGAWISANAGLFEELIFRLYAFLTFAILLRYLNHHTGGWIETAATGALLPAANFLSFGVFSNVFTGADWAIGVAVLIGSVFFRNAHIHYGPLSKANVWLIGLVMFWLTFNYGLITAILAHFLYDLCVFTAIALSSPLQPRPQLEEA